MKKSLDFLEATEECLGLGEGWRLPEKYTDQLQVYLLTNSVNSSWTGIVRTEFPRWRWTNGLEGKPINM